MPCPAPPYRPAARKRKPPVWGIADLGLQENQVGMEGSVTTVMKTLTPDPRGNCRHLKGPRRNIGASLSQIEAVQ